MKKQLLSLAVVSTLSLGSLVSPISFNHASANSISDLKDQKEDLLQEKSGLNAEIQQKESEVGKLQSEQENLKTEIKRLDFAVADAEEKIAAKNEEIKITTAEIKELEVEISVLIERISKRNELLKDRARSLQESGGTVSYMDVLLGAQSFSDFIDRVSAVTTIVQADKDILEQHRKDKEDLERKQEQVQAKLAELQQMKKDLEALRVTLNGQIAEKNELMSELKHEEEQMHTEINDLAEQKQILAAQASAIQKAIQLEQKRQADEARRAEEARKAELERQRAAAEAAKAAKSSGSSSPAPAPAPTVQAAPPVSNGMFMMPANGRITSGLGARWGSYHAGVDIANKASGVPIVAAAGGVVSRSYYSSSYGNVVFISHYMNGQLYTTVYAHMSSRSVSDGAVVSKGQKLGIMGNTGQSFGQHLHFELHKGEWNARKTNAVNPLGYIQ